MYARPAALALGLLALSCGDSEFTTRYASDYVQGARTSVSVLGVYKDGRLNAEAWTELGPQLAISTGGSTCDVAYNEALLANNPSLTDAIDGYTRDNGVTDELLDQFAPSAKGDAILVVLVSGRPPSSDGGAPKSSGVPAPPQPAGGKVSRGPSRRGSYSQDEDRFAPRRPAFEMSASLFSVRQHRSVAQVEMKYTGASIDEAIKRFSERLAAALPGLSCAGWSEAGADPEKIRQLPRP
jgi:hypothetical protein